MKIALISTVYNETDSIGRWIAALRRQTMRPDEFVIVDGGSTDDTVHRIETGFTGADFPKPRVIVQRCNIAGGRNLAIRHTTAGIIATTDAGSIPNPQWLENITQPFHQDATIGVVGGWCPAAPATNEFQRKTAPYMLPIELPEGADCSPSSRNVAFTRASWEAVGGYPEWLTLTAEDSLFNLNLHHAGIRFYHQPSAVVAWEGRPDLRSYLRMMHSYGYGSAEAGQGTHRYRDWILTTVLPPLILISPHPISDAPFRYLRNAATAWGWIRAVLRAGGRHPAGSTSWTAG